MVDRYELPSSLEGKTVLDAGTSDGYFAFEMERRGAARVVAIDIPRWRDLDEVPAYRSRHADIDLAEYFRLAHAMRESTVEYHSCNIYDLTPERFGTFDLVFCGDVLLHLQNPVKALDNLRSVTRDVAIIATVVDPEIEAERPDRSWVRFGLRDLESAPGELATYWIVTARALGHMLEYAGFADHDISDPFLVPPDTGLFRRAAHAYTGARPAWAASGSEPRPGRSAGDGKSPLDEVARISAELAEARARLEAVVRSRRYRLGETIANASAPMQRVLRRLSGNDR